MLYKRILNTRTLLLTAFMVGAMMITSCSKKEESLPPKDLDPIAVETIKTTISTQTKSFNVSGNIQAEEEINISTRMMGYIQNINAEVGDYVRKGSVLVNINNADLQAKLAQVKASIRQAEVGVENAQKDFNRVTKLHEQNSVSQKELDDITTYYNSAKAGLEAAQQMENEVNAQFAYSRITAPFSGRITNKYANTGEIANPGMPILSIARTSNYQAVAMVPENQISSLSKGQKAKVLLKALDKEVMRTIDEISISSNHAGGQYIVKLNLDKHEHKLYAGMFSTITFEGGAAGQTTQILIPENSLIKQGALKGVYTVGANNKVILRWLRIGRKYGNQYEVLSGLNEDETLVVSSESRLFNGAPVTIQ